MFETPDLSKEYHPVPKPAKKVKIPQNKLKTGDRVKDWNKGRDKIKEQFAKWKITKCEVKFTGCLKDNYLTFAHVARRNDLTDEEIVSPDKVVLSCQQCHHTLDHEMKKPDARKLMEKIIKKRSV